MKLIGKFKNWWTSLTSKQKNVILYIWQLPQNLLGLIVILFSRAWHIKEIDTWYTNGNFGVSLGHYIIINKNRGEITLNHERGHQKQSLMLGPVYLVVIGLPSVLGNIARRAYSFDYYSLPWEAWADRLGGVKR